MLLSRGRYVDGDLVLHQLLAETCGRNEEVDRRLRLQTHYSHPFFIWYLLRRSAHCSRVCTADFCLRDVSCVESTLPSLRIPQFELVFPLFNAHLGRTLQSVGLLSKLAAADVICVNRERDLNICFMCNQCKYVCGIHILC